MRNPILLSRSDFRDAVFARDGGLCVLCGAPAVDAHHILERRLWPDGGYYLDNGASVCADDHLRCEQTLVSVENVREACAIRHVLVPPHLYADQVFDKWGNPVLANGRRMRGELFEDASVQKALGQGGVLHLFTDYVKQPRTYHLPWSPGVHDDDRVMDSLEHLHGKRVVVTEKMDGENTSMYRDYIHARSIDSRNSPDRNWVKNFWARICHDIPDRWRLVAENLFAEHSIRYENLESYCYGISIWNARNECLSWDDTQEWFELIGVRSVPIWYDGLFDEKLIRKLYVDERDWDRCEGYVVRLADSFPYSAFRHSVGKFVRAGHVQTTQHWRLGHRMPQNGLKLA